MTVRFLSGSFLLGLLLLPRILCAEPSTPIPDVLTEDIGRFRQLMSSPVAQRRIEGVLGARHLKLQSFEPDLLRLLKDREESVRQEAVLALRRCGTARSIPPLLSLLEDANWIMKEHAHLALMAMTGQVWGVQRADWEKWWRSSSLVEKQTALLADVQSEGAAKVLAAARALRILATEESEEGIRKTLQQNQRLSGESRRMLTEALDRVGSEESVLYLYQRTREGDAAAAWAVGRRGGKQAADALLKGFRRNRSLDFMLNLDRVKSRDCGPFVPSIIRGLSSLISSSARSADPQYGLSPRDRVSANLIRRSGRAPVLVGLILDELEGKRDEASTPKDLRPLFGQMCAILKPGYLREGFGGSGSLLASLPLLVESQSTVLRLIPLLKHPTLTVRIYAALALGRLRAPVAVNPLLGVIREGYAFCDATVPASGKHTAAFRIIDGKRQRQGQTIRWLGYLCMAMGNIGTDEARLALEALAYQPDQPRDVRFGSVVGLKILGSPESIPVLRAVAEKDPIWKIRAEAAEAMDWIRLLNRTRTTAMPVLK